jgi:PKD repeat protein
MGLDLNCAGTLLGSATPVSVGRNLQISGSATLGSGSHAVGQSLTVSGTVNSTGTFVCVGGASGDLGGGGSVPNLTIEKSAGAQMRTVSALTVTGDLRVISGRYLSWGGPVVTVGGNAWFTGGELTQQYGGAIHVAGDVTFAGTVASGAQPDVTCAGDWTGDGAYAPNSGQVTLNGTSPQTIGGAGPRFYNLVIAASSAVTCATNPTLAGSWTIQGSATVADGPLSVGQDLSVSGALDGGPTTLSVGRHVTLASAVAMSGELVCTGSGVGEFRGSGSVGNLTIAKTGTVQMQFYDTLTVGDLLKLSSGQLRTHGGSVLSVSGDALFEGGQLYAWSSGGAIQVAGNATFAGTVALSTQPAITCGGDWTADGAYAPNSGQVTLNGTAPQTIGGAGPRFYNLLITSGSEATCATDSSVGGSATIDGALTTDPGSLLVTGNVSCAGTVLSGPAAGALVCTGSAPANVSGAGSIANLTIDKSGATTTQLLGSLSVGDLLTLRSGRLQTTTSTLVAVGGDASFEGGEIYAWSGNGAIQVAGDLTFAGAVAVSTQPVLRCGGDWLTDGSYQVASLVEFTGDGAVSHSTPGETIAFTDLRLTGGRRTLGAPTVAIQTNLFQLAAGAVLDVEANRLELHVANNSIPVAGLLAAGPGGTLVFDPAAVVAVGPTGGLALLGDAVQPATVTGAGPGGYLLAIGGSLAARNAVFERMNQAGIRVEPTAVLAPAPDDLRAVTFREPFPLAGSVLLDLRRSAPTELRFARFENPLATPGVFNVTTVPTSQPITFVNFGGDLSGETYENDPGTLIVWADPQNTELLSFTGTSAIEEVTLDWMTATEPDVDAFVLQRATDPSGPFETIATVPATGPGLYQWRDQGLDPQTTYTYRLNERIELTGATNVLSTIQATPLSASVQLAFGTRPLPGVTAGDPWRTFTVRIENGQGVLNTSATDLVTIVPVSGGAIAGTLTQAAVGGIATFAGLSATEAGMLRFDVVAGGLTPIVGTDVEIAPAPASELVFATAPTTPVVAGSPWPAFVVRAQDPYGNLDFTFSGGVSVAVTSGTGNLSGTLSRPVIDGLATFADLSYDRAEAIQIACSTPTIPAPLTASITVDPGSAQFLVFGTPPAAQQTAGETFGAFTVEVRDALGNLVAVGGQDVRLGIASGSDTLAGTLVRPLVAGVATFADVSYTKAETIQLSAQLAGYTTATTDGIAVGPAAPAAMVFVAEPASLHVEGSALPSIQVRIDDGYGNLATQATEPVAMQFPAIDGAAFGTLSRTPVDGIATFDDVGVDTAQTAQVFWTSAGLPTLERTIVFAPFASDLRVAAGSLLVTPAAPAVAQPTQIQVGVVNDGQVNTLATARFYLGSPEFGGTLIGETGGMIGVGGNETFVVNWTPTVEGTAPLTVVVENLTAPDETPANNRASTQAYVGAAQVEISVVAGRRTSWPGDSASVSVTIRNVGASAVTLASVVADSPWLTFAALPTGESIPPAATVFARGELAVPMGTVGGPLGGPPVVEPIGITVRTSGGQDFAGTLTVELFDQPTSTLTVRVVDERNSSAIGGALLAFQDLNGVWSTDSSGEVAVNLPAGSRRVAVYKQGYVARSQTVDVAVGAGTAVVALSPGETLAVQTIEQRELTSQEILDRGVSISDPVNNHVVDFVVAMEVGSPLVIPSVELPIVGVPGQIIEVRQQIVLPPSPNEPVPEREPEPVGAYGAIQWFAQPGGGVSRVETWILVPGEIVVLKDFFEVTAIVVNRAEVVQPTDVQLRGVTASLGVLPFGLALPDLDGVPQLPALALGDLDANQTAQATWVVRGDEPGPYTLQVATVGDLFGFDNFLSQVVATAVTDSFEVTVPLLSCAFDTPAVVSQGGIFDFGVRVTNEGSSVAKLVRVNLRAADLRNCGIAPIQGQAELTAEGASVVLGDIAPGATAVATFQLVSALDGSVTRLEIQSGCGGNLSPPVTVVPAPPAITTQPQDMTVCEAGAAAFQVVAAGAGPLSYQWQKDGADIAGAVGPDLVISPAVLGDAAGYRVVVTNEGGSTTSEVAVLTVRPQPVAAFAGAALAGLAPHPVQFTDQSTGEITGWSWDFGDGLPASTAQNPSHTYLVAGVYTVTLQVTGPCGTDAEVKTDYVVVLDPAPVAAFTGTPTVGTAPVTVAFTDQSVGNVASWAWDFGDGSGAAVQNPSHEYAVAGTYTVRLTVVGPGGSDAEVKTSYVRVEPRPEITVFAADRAMVDDGQTATLSFVFSGGDGEVDGQPVQSGGQLVVDPADGQAATYRMVVTNALGVQATAEVQVRSYPLPEVIGFTASPEAVTDGEPSTLGFTFTGGTGAIGGTAVVSGGSLQVVPAIGQATVYRLLVTSPTGTQAHADVTVTSYALPVITALAATPEQVTDDERSTLDFAFSGGVGKISGGGLVDEPVTSGVGLSVDPVDGQATTYTLAVENPAGARVTRDVTVTSHARPEITALAATPEQVTDDERSTLDFAFSGGVGTISGGGLVDEPVTSGVGLSVDPVDGQATTYTLAVENPAGARVTRDVTVSSHPVPAIDVFVVDDPLVTNGTLVQLYAVYSGGAGTVDQGVGAIPSGVPTPTVAPSDVITTYRLTVRNPAGREVHRDLSVEAVPAASIESFTASATTVENGQPVTLTPVFSNGVGVVEPGAFTATSSVSVQAVPPSDSTTPYVLTVTNRAGDSVFASVSVTATALPPTIVQQPQSQTVPIGSGVLFSVGATGVGPLSYVWFKEGSTLSGETSSTLSLSNVQLADAGSYSVEVRNAAGGVLSDAAVLSVTGSCPSCDGGEVRVAGGLLIDFTRSPPALVGDQALLPYTTFDLSGPTPDSWTAIVDVGMKRLVVGGGAVIGTGLVPGGGQGTRREFFAPGLVLRSACGITVEEGGSVDLRSRNAPAGELRLESDGDVRIDGCVLNRSLGDAGRSGPITIAARCGDVHIGRPGLVQTDAGSDLTIVTGGDPLAGRGGSIVVRGLVEAQHRGEPEPTVRLVAFDGAVTVDSEQLRWLGARQRVTQLTGVVVRATRNCDPAGRIEIQAAGDVTLLGNTVWHWSYPNPGAVAIKGHGERSGGGIIDIRSLGGRILASDRAVDNVNHSNGTAINRLYARDDILLLSSGRANSVRDPGTTVPTRMAVVDVSTVGPGEAGTNELRSFAGGIQLMTADTVVRATTWGNAGTDGANHLTSALGVANLGWVLPGDADGADDQGVVSPAVPPALFGSAGGLGVHWR